MRLVWLKGDKPDDWPTKPYWRIEAATPALACELIAKALKRPTTDFQSR